MKRPTIPAMVAGALVLLGTSIVYALAPIYPVVDSPIRTNFDEVDQRGYYTSVQPNSSNLTVVARLAPTGRTDAWRPIPGLIEEYRAAAEFDLAPVIASEPGGVAVAKLRLTLKEWYDPGEAYGGLHQINLLLKPGGYQGDGKIAGLTEEAGLTNSYPGSLSPDFSPSGLTPFAPFWVPVDASAGWTKEIGVTSFVNDLILKQGRWAGFNVAVDYSCLPARSSIAGDTSWGVRLYPTNNGDPTKGPQLVVTTYPTHDLNATISQYQAAGLSAIKAKGLSDKVNAAAAALTRDQPEVVKNVLNAFIKNVNSLVKDGFLTKIQGDSLIEEAEEIIDSLGGWG